MRAHNISAVQTLWSSNGYQYWKPSEKLLSCGVMTWILPDTHIHKHTHTLGTSHVKLPWVPVTLARTQILPASPMWRCDLDFAWHLHMYTQTYTSTHTHTHTYIHMHYVKVSRLCLHVVFSYTNVPTTHMHVVILKLTYQQTFLGQIP